MNKILISAMLVAGLACIASATLVYGHDMRNNRFVTFDHATPGAQTVIATQTTDYFGLDFNASATTLYGLSSVGSLDTINLGTGAVSSSVAITGAGTTGFTGITFGTSNNLYLSTFTAAAGSVLYSLNATTGAATVIGQMHATDIIIDISMDSTGRMVGHGIATDTFSFVNTSTAALTLIGPHGLLANFAQGMDFDWTTNTLYAAVYTGGGTLTYGSVNLGTGAVTSIPGIISGEYELAVQAVPEPATMVALGLGAVAFIRRRRK